MLFPTHCFIAGRSGQRDVLRRIGHLGCSQENGWRCWGRKGCQRGFFSRILFKKKYVLYFNRSGETRRVLWRAGSCQPRTQVSKKEKTRFFFCFSLSAKGVFPRDRVSLFPSRWLAVAASERKAMRSLATRPSKTFCFPQENKHFCKIAPLHAKMVGVVS